MKVTIEVSTCEECPYSTFTPYENYCKKLAKTNHPDHGYIGQIGKTIIHPDCPIKKPRKLHDL